MRNYIALLISLVFLTACGGGGGNSSAPPPVPFGSVSGTAFDGLILNGTVSIYDFSTGAKGALLGQATTDSSSGLYSLSLQIESRPILIEITGGYYVEEAGVSGASTQVSLGSNHQLTALANYTTGTALKVAATTYTHLAAGLAAYNISKGTAVADAINSANTRASSLAGINIITTTPRQITDVGNASATLTPELKYGFLAGAISMWTLNNTPNTAIARTQPYTSIDFAQLLYQDISADGLLDGIGLDSTGAAAPLSFGTTPMGVGVYRIGIGVGLVQMAGNANNKTGIDGAKILPFAQAYIANTDAMFNGVAPIAFVPAAVVISSPATGAWVRKSINVASTASSPFGIKTVELLVDGGSVATSANLAAQSFPIVTTAYAAGAHTIDVRATDLGGFVTTASIQLNIDNIAPTATGSYYYYGSGASFSRNNNGAASDSHSGAVSATIIANGQTVSINAGGSWSLITSATAGTPYNVLWPDVRITDLAGNCTVYYYNQAGWGEFLVRTANAC